MSNIKLSKHKILQTNNIIDANRNFAHLSFDTLLNVGNLKIDFF